MNSEHPIFVVLTTPSALDTGMAAEAIRTITDNPWHALAVARMAIYDKDAVFVSQAMIYRLEWKKLYTLCDYVAGPVGRDVNPNLVFLAYRASYTGKWVERFRNGFKDPELKELPIETAFKAGNLGKLRVVALLDSDPHQVGDEVGTPEEAFWLSKTQPSEVEVSIHNAFGERLKLDQEAVEELASGGGWKS